MPFSAIQRSDMDRLLATRNRRSPALMAGAKRATTRQISVDSTLALSPKKAEKLREYMSAERLEERLSLPTKDWSIGVSRLAATPAVDDATARHLKHLAKASALFDQFCVGFSMDPFRQRLHFAFRLVDRSETARLPDEDTLANVFDELAFNSAESSMYVYLDHEDGTHTWCDFGAEPIAPEPEDLAYCEELLADYPDGAVLTFAYKVGFCFAANTMDELLEGVGVVVNGELVTRHQLTLPHRETSLDTLTLEVGNYYRSLQSTRVMNFVSPAERSKRRSATKAKRKMAKKARRR